MGISTFEVAESEKDGGCPIAQITGLTRKNCIAALSGDLSPSDFNVENYECNMAYSLNLPWSIELKADLFFPSTCSGKASACRYSHRR